MPRLSWVNLGHMMSWLHAVNLLVIREQTLPRISNVKGLRETVVSWWRRPQLYVISSILQLSNWRRLVPFLLCARKST